MMKEELRMPKEKKPFKMPHTFVIIISIILFVTAMTWLIPAGEYVRYKNAAGIEVIDPTQFSFVERTPVNPLRIPLYIVEAICKRISLMLVILFSGGAFALISKSGALHAAVAKVAKLFKDRLYVFIPIMTTVFALICTTQGVNQFIAFAPIVVMITMAMGLDSIVGAAIILLGGCVGFSTGTLNPSTPLVVREGGAPPPYSGIGYRIVCFAVFLIVTNIYLIRYATKIRRDPTLSPMYELDKDNEMKHLDMDSFGALTLRKGLIVAALAAALALMVYGGIKFSWDMEELAAVFIGLAVVVGFLAGETPSSMSVIFIDGCKKMLTAALIIGLATAIANVMTAGHIVDTVIYGLSSVMSYAPKFLVAPVMYLVNTLISFVIVSGSGMASAVMPITAPLGDLLGLTRQTTVLIFNFSDGFTNYILPHSTALMGIISAVNIPYDRWMKFMWKLFVIWMVICCIMVYGAQMMHYA